MNEVLIGLYLGTSGVRAIAVDLQGNVVGQATRNYPLLCPQPGWTEQNPADWTAASFAALSEVAQQLMHQTPIALGLSGQMHGLVALTGGGTVVRPAILWNDQRTEQAVAEIEAVIPRSTLIQRTGNRAVTGFQLPKLIWLRQAEPQAFTQTQQVLLPKDYLGYVLTGNSVTEPSDASGTGCLQLSTRQWDSDILEALQLSPDLFPPVVESTAITGRLKPDLATQIGLPPGLPIIAGGGDNAAAAVGVGISSAQLHQGSISLGTSGVIFAPVEQPTPDPEGRVHLFCHVDGGYHLLGVTLAAGGALRWYRDTFAPNSTYSDLMNLAALAPPGAQGVLFLPHLAGERTPYLDPEARGAWVNLALAHHQAELVRALLEGVAFSLRLTQQVMSPLSSLDTLIATGGGAKSAVWLEILADVLGVSLLIPQAEAGAAYGAALLAMVGIGVYAKVDQVIHQLSIAASPTAKLIQPHVNPIYDKQFEQFARLYEALKVLR
jgi:xylulokinase